jgi:streptomycin 6-kinase
MRVDPVLLRGDIEYDLARVLWTRIDEMPDAAAIVGHFDAVVREAGLDRERARDWVVFRTADYWLWGLSVGLTEDPVRCQRLASVFMDREV